MNGFLFFILAVIGGQYLLDVCISLLNLRSLSPDLPEEFAGVYDRDKYSKSQQYTRVTTRFSLVQTTLVTGLTILFIWYGGFNQIDLVARSAQFSPLYTGLLFMALLGLISTVLNLPFSLYSTFVIEERFGFNTTTLKTYILDMLKGTLLAVLIGGPLLGFILWFFEVSGSWAWFYCWVVILAFIVIMQFLAPVVIMPLFNTFTPLEDGELKEAVTRYAKQQHFGLQGIYTMDGSKRSKRANAFFTGFGKYRRIVFFDTLIHEVSTKELVAILAHEMGHFKKRHIIKMMVASALQTGVMLYIMSLFINNEQLAAETTGESDSLISGLKQLSVSNLSNLTPHPLHVFFHYSHPPVLQRIQALQAQHH